MKKKVIQKKSRLPVDDLKAYEIIRDEIRYEYNLMSNRVTWLIAAQAFLFVAYTNDVNIDSVSKFHLIIFFLGILIGFVIYLSVVAAILRVNLWRKEQYDLQDKFKKFSWKGCQPSSFSAVTLGLGPSLIFPPAFICAWIYIFLNNNQYISIYIVLIFLSLFIVSILDFKRFWEGSLFQRKVSDARAKIHVNPCEMSRED